MKPSLSFLALLSFLLISANSYSQSGCSPGTVLSFYKISSTQGGFTGVLDDEDWFCRVQYIGDINNDGVVDLAVGAGGDDDGGNNRGAVWILFMNNEGEVQSFQKISDTQGGFTGGLSDMDEFGWYITPIGDLNNDGVLDIAVGAWGDDDGGLDCGAVWVLFLNLNGTVNSYQKISATQGGLVGLTPNRVFGSTLTEIGDLNGDGVTDLAVGTPNYDNTGGLYRGCVWILFLNSNGTVNSQQLINEVYGNFNVTLHDNDRFGKCIDLLGDLNGDGVNDIVVSSKYDDGGGLNRGAVYILFLNTDGTVNSYQKINDVEGGFTGVLDDEDRFGYAVSSLGDLDGDDVTDIAVGAFNDDDGGTNKGAVWILFLNQDGTVKSHQKISELDGDFTGTLDAYDWFGMVLSSMGDINDDGNIDLAVGVGQDDDGGFDRGAVYILSLCTGDLCVSDFSYTQMPGSTEVDFSDASNALGAFYLWDFGDGDTSVLQNPVHTYSDFGNYEVCLTIATLNNFTCTHCDTVSLVLSDNLIDSADNSITAFPNPVKDKLNIDLNSNSISDINIFSLTGQIMNYFIHTQQHETKRLTVDTKALPKGIYLLQIEQDKTIIYKKFVKE